MVGRNAWPVLLLLLFSCDPGKSDHGKSSLIAEWRSSKGLSGGTSSSQPAESACTSADGDFRKSAMVWKHPAQGDVMDLEDMSEWGIEVERNMDVSQEALHACLPSNSHSAGVSRCSLVIQANKFVVANQSCAVECSAQDEQDGPCHVSCPKRPSVKGNAHRDGVYHLSVFVELFDEGSASRRPLAPPATISVLVGEETHDIFAAFLAEYAAVHRRSRSAPRACTSEDGLESWQSGHCLRALVYRCGETSCGGYTDRLKGILSLFLLALFSGRSFFIEHARPRRLDALLEPDEIDWRPDAVAFVADRRNMLQRSQWRDYEVLDPSGAHRVPKVVIPLILDPSVAVIAVTHNLNLFASLLNLPEFYSFAWEAGMLGLLPSPARHSYEFLFRHSATFQTFFDTQLALLPFPAPILSHLARPPKPAKDFDRKVRIGGEQEDSETVLIALQVRGGRKDWSEVTVVETEAQVHGALECAALLASQFGVAASRAYVLVVTPTTQLYDWASKLAPTVGFNASRVSGVRPPVMAHLDRSARDVAAEAMNYVVLENELMSRASALVVSSGFGETAADYGGVPPRSVVNIKFDVMMAKQQFECTPNLPDVWFA